MTHAPLRLACFVAAILTLLPASVFACLNSTELSAINNISTATNTSNATLIAIFQSICSRADALNSTILNVSSNTSSTSSLLLSINSSLSGRISSLNGTVNSSISSLDSNIASNYTYLDNLMSGLQGNISTDVSRQKTALEDIFDTKIKDFKKEFVTEQEFNSTTLQMYNAVRIMVPWWVRWTPVGVGVLILMFGVYAAYERKKGMKTSLLLPSVNPEEHTIEELATESELLHAKIDLREAKKRILESDLSPEGKIKAMDTLFRGIVTKKELEMLLTQEQKKPTKERGETHERKKK